MDLAILKMGTEDFVPVYFKKRYHHCLEVGSTGSGKTSLMGNWIYSDSFFPYSKIVIEPHGELSKQSRSYLKNCHYCSLDNPVSINPLTAPYHPNDICEIVAEALNQTIELTTPNEHLTVKMRAILDHAIKYCLEKQRTSLVNVLDFLLNQKGDAQTRDGIIARLHFLVNDERIQPIVCGNDPIQWGKMIEKGESFIMDCSGMSEQKMIFVGNLISQGIKNYFRFERRDKYKPVALYIDECHNFISANFFDILKEGRKFKISATLATQDFALIPDKLVRVMMNVGTIVCFRVRAREAFVLSREVGLQSNELQFLKNFHAAYVTEDKHGVVKTMRPPPVLKAEKVERKPKESGWFQLLPYQQA